MNSGFSKANERAEAMRKFISERNNVTEHYIAQYLERTGHPIEEVVLCESSEYRDGNLVLIYWCELKGDQ